MKLLLRGITPVLNSRSISRFAYTATPCFLPPTLQPRRHYSQNSPASSQQLASTKATSPAPSNGHNSNGQDPLTNRHELAKSWHSEARSMSAVDLRWEGRDKLEATCTIIRDDGRVEDRIEPLSKQELLDDYGLQPRDLRSLDAHILDVRPSILVCKRSIIFCTPILRCIIAHDKLIVIGVDSERPLVNDGDARELVDCVTRVLGFVGKVDLDGKETPFELRALEALLLITIRGFKHVASDLQERVYNLLPTLRKSIGPSELRDLLESKRAVEDCLYSGRALQSAISTLLSEDEDLAGMYLSDKFKKVARSTDEHQTAELLLEYYERRLDETNESSLRLSSLLNDVDSNITLLIASSRIRLQTLELQTAISTLALAAGATIAGFFGMNLTSGLEGTDNAFLYTTAVGISSMGLIMIIGWIRLIRARRSQLFLGDIGRHSRSTRGRASRVEGSGETLVE